MQNSWFILNGDIILLQSVEVYTLPELKCPHGLQQEYSSLSSACLKYVIFFIIHQIFISISICTYTYVWTCVNIHL